MAWQSPDPPPAELKQWAVSNKVLRQIIEQIQDEQRVSYNLDGYPNIRVGPVLYRVVPRSAQQSDSDQPVP